MNTKTSVVFGIIAVAAAVLLFAAGPIVSTHQALAWGGGFGGGFGGAGGGGASSTSSQISSWVQSHFTAETVGGVTLYDLTAPVAQS